ncbi:PRTRC system ThiF family protein [Pedobacter sp. G11]|uniref:PRTRC system ThiF family protein n=1 Tax=Pedobacter sp. G11 TaxID=2482728 RepID=UPI000F5D4F0A|nr:PRTRC system ThiF family protein [Pedobacter sp. G11]AZI26805.1 PRTRC system ThiF family protein [Pedobacter sp. G11]
MNAAKKRVHIVYPYLISPTNPVSVNLIGAGGTGSQMLTALARINQALIALGHAGLQVNVFDDDVVQQANLARQLFTSQEIGLNKAVVLINRINRFFGTNWKAVPQRFEHTDKKLCENRMANITVCCVDTVESRINIEALLCAAERKSAQRDSNLYLLDFGNSKETGQVLLSTIGEIAQPESKEFNTVGVLPSWRKEYSSLLEESEDNDPTPSCSLAEALEKQDLFINSALVNIGASLLWKMFKEGMLMSRGFFLNLADYRTQPIPI